MHSTETERKSKCISNITVHINIHKRQVYLRKKLFSISPRAPPPNYSNPLITVILSDFQPPDYSHPPLFIRYSRVPTVLQTVTVLVKTAPLASLKMRYIFSLYAWSIAFLDWIFYHTPWSNPLQQFAIPEDNEL